MLVDLSVKQRLIAGFGCVLGIMLAVVLVTAVLTAHMCAVASSIIDDLSPQVRAANALAVAVQDQRSALRAYVVTGQSQFHKDYQAAVDSEQSATAKLANRLTETDDRETFEKIRGQLAHIRQDEAKVIALLNGGDKDGALRHHQSHVDTTINEVVESAERMSLIGHQRIRAASRRFAVAGARLEKLTLGSLAVAMLFVPIFILATIRAITEPARRIASATDAVTSGNFGEAIGLEKKYGRRGRDGGKSQPRNELRQIAVAIAAMARVLKQREQKLQAHSQVSDVCASAVDLDQLVTSSLAELAKATHSQAAAMYVAGPGGLVARGTFGISKELAGADLLNPDGLAEQTAKSRQLIVITDVPNDTRFLVRPGLGKAIPKTIACIPMTAEGTDPGVIVLASLYEYDGDTIEFMKTATAQVGVAVSNAIRHANVHEMAEELRVLNEQLDAQNEELQAQSEEIRVQSEEIQEQNTALHERNLQLEEVTDDLMALQTITAVALSSLEVNELLERLLEAVAGGLGLPLGLVMLLDEERQMLRSTVAHNIRTSMENPFELHIGEGFAGMVAESGEIMTLPNAQSDPIIINPAIKAAGVRSLVGVPLAIGDKLYGVALLGGSEQRAFTSREKHLLEVFAVRAATAIDRAQSYERLRLAEARARTDRDHLQAIIDNIPEAIIIAAAPDGRLITVNKVAISLLGIEQMPETNLWNYPETFHLARANGEPVAAEDLPLSRSLLTGEVCSGEEVLIRNPSGREIIVLVNTVPVMDDNGNVTGAISVFQDISHIKLAQRALQEDYEYQRSVSRQLQKVFLPDPNAHPVLAGYEIAAAYEPAHSSKAEVGGDFYDLIPFDDGILGIVMADVSGKGVGAAIYTAMAKYMLRGFAHENIEPAGLLTRMNEAVARYVHGEVFVTLFYGVLYASEGKLVYANAGHEIPLVFRAKSGECSTLESTGPALGVIRGGVYSEGEVQLADGDSLVLYTDGVTDARSSGDFLGQEGLEQIIRRTGNTSASRMINEILSKVKDFSSGELRDDAALLVVKSCRFE